MNLVLAKIIGPYILALGVGLFLNSERFRKLFQQSLNEPFLVFITALVTLLMGSTIVSLHNVWVWGWPVIITILGWWTLVNGFVGVSFPELVQKCDFVKNSSSIVYKVIGASYIALAAFLIYKGLGY